MSGAFDTLHWAKRARTGSLSRKSTLLALASYCDERNSCFPSQETLAADTEQSVRSVRRALADLERLGLIKRVARRDKRGQRTSDRYFLLVDDRPASVDQPDNLAGGQPDNGDHPNRTLTAVPTGHSVQVRTKGNTNGSPAADARAGGHLVHQVGGEVLRRMGVLDDPRWLGNYGRVAQWLAEGAEPELDIYPTIDRLMARRGGKPPRSLYYFDDAVATAIRSRTAPLPEGDANHGRNPSRRAPGSAAETDRRRAGLAAAATERLAGRVSGAGGT